MYNQLCCHDLRLFTSEVPETKSRPDYGIDGGRTLYSSLTIERIRGKEKAGKGKREGKGVWRGRSQRRYNWRGGNGRGFSDNVILFEAFFEWLAREFCD